MTDIENYILSAIFFLAFCAIFYFWKKNRGKKASNGQQKYVAGTLDLARSQFEMFNIRMQMKVGSRAGLTAILHDIDKNGIHFEVGDFVPEEWNGKPVDVYFKVVKDSEPVFYVFSSRVIRLKSDYEASRLLLEMPQLLRIEKKRHFIRVSPAKNDVRVIGVWPLLPGKKLPDSTADLGDPLTHYNPDMKDEQVRLENISGAGLALRIYGTPASIQDLRLEKGAHILCLVVYALQNDNKEENTDKNKVAFWCTGEVMNVRVIEGENPAVVLGLEFTNWAVLEQGQNEIHWAHSSPSRGAKPILQWVEQIDKKQRKQT